MKALTLIALLTSASAFACPKLAGKYATCRSGNGMFLMTEINISQSKITNGSSYVVNVTNEAGEKSNMVLLATGKREVLADIFGSPVVQTTKCEKNAVVTKIEYKDGTEILPWMTLRIEKKGSELTMDYHGLGGQEDIITCHLTM